ncbi:hypothetical protein [Staphylococcus aureus]|uniref:hypothetical protein n=1 Tax=Staphylococcus aureus TaxID=1280 RepID=UPI000DFB4032|nr:hypothetical protein [Staphylococcus aureus]SUL46226.1 putative biofilm-associated protein [Staphylococcus aureus]
MEKTATSKVDEKGNWTVDVPEGTELKVGNEITATETDMSGNKSESGKGKVTDTTAPEAPSVNDTEVGSKKSVRKRTRSRKYCNCYIPRWKNSNK